MQICIIPQAVPQAPQLDTSTLVSTQDIPQRTCPAGHPDTHTPMLALHTGVAPVHALPHAPQFVVLLSGVSHPLAAIPSQLPKPAEHMPIPQVDAVQAGVPFVTAPHAAPQRPQCETLLARSVSQPSETIPLQFPRLALQVIPHVPIAHDAVPPAEEHTVVHVPHAMTLEAVLSSHPFPGSPSQLEKPAVHVPIRHIPAVHRAAAFAKPQTVPHAPQFAADERRSTSHPSAASMLQLAKLALQVATWQTPLVQVAVPFAAVQARRHIPQFPVSVWTFTSQPFIGLPSQSAKPGLHVPIAHVPERHTGVALGSEQALPQLPQCIVLEVVSTQLSPQRTAGAVQPDTHMPIPAVSHTGVVPEHARPHRPQFVTESSRASQPFIALPSQSPKPGRQGYSQPRIPQVATALRRISSAQRVPHARQLSIESGRSRRASHPLAALRSQSPRPGSQVIPHIPALHVADPPAAEHALPQRPQCAALVRMSTSQPFIAFPSQLAKPMSQRSSQVPPLHTALWFGPPAGQALPQRPQLSGSFETITQRLPQDSVPASHAGASGPTSARTSSRASMGIAASVASATASIVASGRDASPRRSAWGRAHPEVVHAATRTRRTG